MIRKATEAALNDQIQSEFYSAYLYLAMAAYFDTQKLPGLAHWMGVQSDEERAHAMRLYKFVQDHGGTVKLQAIPQPPARWKSPLAAFQQALEHERGITASINKIYELAVKEKDYPTQIELQWFIKEQVEEEQNVELIVHQLKLIDARGTAVLMLDHRMGKRGKD